ncbi:MAG: dihydrofolate reductase family protein [Candidatus Zapsychrus exili]|nr:dihydrofolate reductase family protein [Candidatus Zapsychrus exili]
MSNYVFVATSLDGFIADENGGIDWLMEVPNPDKIDYGYAELMKNTDALVMGRSTFEKVLTFGEWFYTKPVFVVSNSLTEIPENLKDKVEIVKGDMREVVRNLNSQGYKNLYVDGGKLIQSFLKEDLIDELIINKIPILLGRGIPLFGEIDQKLKFKHTKTEVFNDSLVMSCYLRDRDA